MASVLFIPDRFTDHRMWTDVPDRIRDRAETIHFDEYEPVPWTTVNGEFLKAARRLAADHGFTVVAAAGHAARFGFAVAEAELARSLILFNPDLDRIFPETLSVLYEHREDLSERLNSTDVRLLVDAASEPDRVQRRAMYLEAVRNGFGSALDPAVLELGLAMFSDHADEILDDLQSLSVAAAAGQPERDPPWIEHPWIDRLADLDVPVTAVLSPRARGAGQVIAARARSADIVVAEGDPGLGLR